MRVSHLDIFGFKSFYNKTAIHFGDGITGVVGPNGCGKSNVVEAIRWVLGEQRAAAIRGHKMEDVIFAGTRARKPLGMSEVSLTVDNTEGVLAIDYTEVTITRRLFRSGESDYLLNKVPCRLLDIQNLLMDTGLGPGAYSVMEQGMVDEIVSEKTENRRRIIEEAAGITKYKARRRSTWNKLESTDADLTRLEDIITEVKRQFDYLGRQVGRARRFQTLSTELKDVELRFSRHRYFSLRDELQPLDEEFQSLSRDSESGLTEFTAREAELEKRRLAVTDAERTLQEAGVALSRCVEEIHELDNQLISTRERREAREHFIERATAQLEESRQQLNEANNQRTQAEATLVESRAEIAHSAEQLHTVESAAQEAEAAYAESRRSLDAENHKLRDILREKGERSGALVRLRTEREGLDRARQEAENERARLESEKLETSTRVSETQQLFQTTQERLAALQADLQAAHQRRQDTQSSLERGRKRTTDAERGIEAGQARIQILERVRSGYEGYSSGVRQLLVDSPYAATFNGVLGDLVEVTDGLDRAVESALGDAVEALVARDDESILEALAYVRDHSARAGVFPMNWQRQTPTTIDLEGVDGVIAPLRNYVRADDTVTPLVDHLLANTFLVNDLKTALRLARDHADLAVRLVTADGQGVDIDGRVAGGEAGEDDSVLGRGQEIRQLRAKMATQRSALITAQLGVDAESRRVAVLDGYTRDLQALVEQVRDEEREAHLRERAARDEGERLDKQLQALQTRVQSNEQRFAGLREGSQGEEQRLQQIDAEAAQLEQSLREREERLQEAERNRRERQEMLQSLRVERARIVEKGDNLGRDVQRLTSLEGTQRTNIDRLEKEISQAAQDRTGLQERESAATDQLTQKHDNRESLATDREEQHNQWQEVMVRSRELEEEIGRLQRELSVQRERRHQLELRVTELRTELKQLLSRVTDEYEVDLPSLGPLEEDDFDSEKAKARLEEIRRGLARLGNVHVGVLEEFEEQKERYDFLVQHRDDLIAASEDLRKTLQHIDRVARRLFRETFEEIREKFQVTYARFFPGGEADLTLEADVDPLESSIEITARPRGKRLQSIGLLSGGEKALTAIALLFAIYQVKPSPWCILDEVDAPLDDANVERFLRVLREFAQHTQFIMITHNKLSMSSADTLHGVTMAEEGVSQLVSVQVAAQAIDNEAAG